MKKTISCILSLSMLLCASAGAEGAAASRILYQGHGSLRIVTGEGKVIYVDPYAGEGYDLPADLILITHAHQDHTNTKLIKTQNEGCQIITWKEAHPEGKYLSYDLGFVTVEAVQAGNNRNHNIKECVGWVITLPEGITVYVSGDTSTTEQMAELAGRNIDYAFFVCDGVYNMGLEEAAECAKTVNAKHAIPYHMAPGKLFDEKKAEQFDAPNRLIVPAGEEIVLEKE